VIAQLAFATTSRLQHKLLIATEYPACSMKKERLMVVFVRTASIAIAVGMQLIGIALIVGV
jgi:hypothetical protein